MIRVSKLFFYFFESTYITLTFFSHLVKKIIAYGVAPTTNLWLTMIDLSNLFWYMFHGVITFSYLELRVLQVNHGW
jgi:hypothetical protein